MKKSIFLFFSILMFVFANAQNNLTVTSMVGTPVETILQQHLAGDGVLLSGCPYPQINSSFETGKFNTATGNVQSAQIGTFNRNNSSFPFQNGIIMTTGNVSVAAGPNSGSSCALTSGVTDYTDPQLLSMMSSIQHCAALEFDFVASADTFAFNYIFASEEYPEYACSGYNDVFAFFLSGIDPVTTVPFSNRNVAIIPGTITSSNPNGVPVTINSINPGPGSNASTPPNCTGTPGQYSSFYLSNPPGVEYDGSTVALTAAATILACQKYHMKMAIGNVGDNGYDSGVFLEEGSFYSPRVTMEEEWENDLIGEDTLIQHCRDMDLTFKLPRPALTGNTDIIFNTSGDAALGVDYSLVLQNGMEITPTNNTFTYQPGDTVQQVHVKILPTAQFASSTQVKIANLDVVTQGCSSTQYMDGFPPYSNQKTLYLRANDSIRLRDTVITRCDSLDTLRVQLVRGVPPFTYHWIDTVGTGIVNDLVVDSNDSMLVTPCKIRQSGTFRVVASDKWNCMTDTATVQVNIVPKPTFNLTYSPDKGCVGDSVTMRILFNPDTSYLHWKLINDTIIKEDSLDATPSTIQPVIKHLNLPVPGYYDISLFVESAPGCNDSAKYQNAIHVSDYPHADFSYGPDEPGNGEEVFFFNNSTGDNITDYAWNFGDGHSSHDEEPKHTYHLTESDFMTVRLVVTNSDGCTDDTIQVISVEDHFALFVPSGFTPNSDSKNEIFQPKVNDVIDYELTIYARNGELVFHTNSPEMGWDGTVRGKPAPEGVYVWKIHYARMGTPDEKEMRMGTVTLIR